MEIGEMYIFCKTCFHSDGYRMCEYNYPEYEMIPDKPFWCEYYKEYIENDEEGFMED